MELVDQLLLIKDDKIKELKAQLFIATEALTKISIGTDQTRSANHISERALREIEDRGEA